MPKSTSRTGLVEVWTAKVTAGPYPLMIPDTV
jgi:hypothetical protein